LLGIHASVVWCAGTSERAKKAARDARGTALLALLALNAGPSVLNPSFVLVRSGKPQQARLPLAHEQPKPARRAKAATHETCAVTVAIRLSASRRAVRLMKIVCN
jgi:hypothetical protein